MAPTVEDLSRDLSPEHLVAHRGYAKRYPENTELALARAVDLGVRLLEFDIHLTSDRVPVLIHDRDLMRTGARRERIAELSTAELQSISVHHPERFGERFLGERIPTLERIVDWLRPQTEVRSFVEVKRKALAVWGAEMMVPIVLDALTPILDRSIFISFDLDSVVLARKLGAPEIAWVVETWNDDTLARAQDLAPEFLFVNHEKIPAGAVLRGESWQWVVYEVETVEHARELRGRGVDLIETMAVGEMVQALTGDGASV